jgi:hypothetical protein
LENLEEDGRILLLKCAVGKYILRKGGGEAELFQDGMQWRISVPAVLKLWTLLPQTKYAGSLTISDKIY